MGVGVGEMQGENERKVFLSTCMLVHVTRLISRVQAYMSALFILKYYIIFQV